MLDNAPYLGLLSSDFIVIIVLTENIIAAGKTPNKRNCSKIKKNVVTLKMRQVCSCPRRQKQRRAREQGARQPPSLLSNTELWERFSKVNCSSVCVGN